MQATTQLSEIAAAQATAEQVSSDTQVALAVLRQLSLVEMSAVGGGTATNTYF
jgi:hypothetical protein